jgi:hypothetical protein
MTINSFFLITFLKIIFFRLGEKSMITLDCFIALSPRAPFQIYNQRELLRDFDYQDQGQKSNLPQLLLY